MMKHQTYAVKGMHCASCEAIIEKKLLKLPGITAVDASIPNGTVTIAIEGDAPLPEVLTGLFPDGLYTFSEPSAAGPKLMEAIRVLGYAATVIVLFFGLSASGLLPSLAIDSSSSFGAFFLFGLIAGMSTCAALVGGLVLTLSAQWADRFDSTTSLPEKLRPQIMFNSGRIAAYTLTGALLGLLGGSVRLSPSFTSIMVVAVSALMMVLAFQMLGFSPFKTLRIALPKKLVNAAGNGVTRTGGLLRPFPSGFMTVLLPCGFTMAAEGAAMLSGNPWHGMAIMFFFVLGTMPTLLAIGLSSAELGSRPGTSRIFMKTAGMLIIFLTVYNLNSQFGIAAKISGQPTPPAAAKIAAPSLGSKVIRTTYTSAADIVPAKFEIKRGEKVRFIVDPKDTGSGCMSTIMVPGLWNRSEDLVKGRPIVMEFTPSKPGTYQITCAMGIPRGVITVK
jgi:sulfite exporter TauE/SafE/copper chaperone CopZ